MLHSVEPYAAPEWASGLPQVLPHAAYRQAGAQLQGLMPAGAVPGAPAQDGPGGLAALCGCQRRRAGTDATGTGHLPHANPRMAPERPAYAPADQARRPERDAAVGQQGACLRLCTCVCDHALAHVRAWSQLHLHSRSDALGCGQVRKLEFLMADAQERMADCVITVGGIQSNHCRATAVAARQVLLHRICWAQPVTCVPAPWHAWQAACSPPKLASSRR